MSNYDKFYQLHHQQAPFILANVWNVKSAQLLEKAGYEAIGTSSGAISSSLGYEDGEMIPFTELLYIVQRIKLSTNIPLSVDIERGYGDDLNVLRDNIQKLLDLGVSGINIEDSQGEDIYLKKLECIKNYLLRTNQQLFINARIDAFLQKLQSPVEITIKRAGLYREAGADGLFVPAAPDTDTIKEITWSTPLPVNIVGTPNFPVQTLANSGVRRISMAVLLYRSTYEHLGDIAGQIAASTATFPLS
ncbi:isocitrate lyase/PEP mutase family protein [Desertivirga brevis]|uniref:isocitrate lyase/PEP mutase family protein n=1 Tax=Desertivirga brevis TaxID=2810310 RepID=UPI001A9563BD|nr:isocitrate lyase/phosphoenolpyruvate mutase family protein [Pedobacter sp. SYSU D00873]